MGHKTQPGAVCPGGHLFLQVSSRQSGVHPGVCAFPFEVCSGIRLCKSCPGVPACGSGQPSLSSGNQHHFRKYRADWPCYAGDRHCQCAVRIFGGSLSPQHSPEWPSGSDSRQNRSRDAERCDEQNHQPSDAVLFRQELRLPFRQRPCVEAAAGDSHREHSRARD